MVTVVATPATVTTILTELAGSVVPAGGATWMVTEAPLGATRDGRPFGYVKNAAGPPRRHTKRPRLMSLPITVPLGKYGHTFHRPLNCAPSSAGHVSK